jgi:hypothetical protein
MNKKYKPEKLYYFAGKHKPVFATSAAEARSKKRTGGDRIVMVVAKPETK